MPISAAASKPGRWRAAESHGRGGDAANVYATDFIGGFNARFGKPPRNPKEMHRPLADHENVDAAMCHKEVRTLSQCLTLRYDKVLFVLDLTEQAKALAGKKVVVCDYPDGRLEIIA